MTRNASLLRCVLLVTDVDGRLWRTPLVADSSLSHGVSTELVSPPLSKDCKHCLAVAAIDAVQFAVIGPANETTAGMLWWSCVLTDFTHNRLLIID